MQNGEIVKDYLSKWPDLNSLTLARLVYNANPETFKDIDSVRSFIRYYRDNKGVKDRSKNKDKTFVRTDGDQRRANPYRLPLNDEIPYEPYIIPIAQNNILWLCDFHIPYHNLPACNAAIEYGINKSVNTIILAGDFFDFYQISTFNNDPRKRHIPEELEIGAEFLDALREAFPDAVFYFLVGNHEYRLERYLRLKAPELYGIPDFRLDVLLKFGERKINYISDKRIIKMGKLNGLHGHEFGGGINIPVNPARTVYLKTHVSTIVGHSHWASEHSATHMNGDLITCFSVAGLMDLHPEYRPINNWGHGLGHIRINPDGDFRVFNARIYEGKVL